MIKNKKIAGIGLIIAIVVIVIDQLSKLSILALLKDVGSVNVLPFFDLTLIYNKGISFGMISGGSNLELIIISAITLAIVAVLTRWLTKTDSKYKATCIGLIIGGAFGNAIDRFSHEGVVDFIDLYVGKYHYPAFNVADSCICIAVVLLLLENVLVKEVKK